MDETFPARSAAPARMTQRFCFHSTAGPAGHLKTGRIASHRPKPSPAMPGPPPPAQPARA